MKKYKPIYVSPTVQAELKAFAAREFRSMGEMAEEIIMNHIEGSDVGLVESLEEIKNIVACVSFYKGAENFIEATNSLIESLEKGEKEEKQ